MRFIRIVLFVTTAVLISVSGLPTAAQASDARTDALGIQREYLEDYILFRAFPTVAARYQNLVTASLGDRNLKDRSMGVIKSGRKTSYGTFALYLNDIGDDNRQDAQIDLTWAKQFSGMALGLGLNWVSSSREFDSGTKRSPIGSDGANQLAVVAGVKADLSDSDQLEAAVELASLSFDRFGVEDDAGLSFRLSARMMKELNEQTTLVPLIQYIHVDVTAENAPDNTSDSFNLGVAAHHQVNGNDLLVMGVAVNYFKAKSPTEFSTAQAGFQEDEFSRWDLPALFAALEFSVYDWLTARVGATKTIDVVKNEPVSGNDFDETSSRFFFGLGMGIHFDHFDVDATVNPDAVFTGGYLFSGSSSQPLGRITGTYYF